MKLLIACALFAVTQATYYHVPSIVSSGISSQYRSQDNSGNYKFGYDEAHASGGTFRRESGDVHGNKYGSYGLAEADGRQRIVNYIADGSGFRASIQTNEPGVGYENPASTTISKGRTFIAAPATAYVAPPAATYVSRTKSYPYYYPTYVTYGHPSYPYASYAQASYPYVSYGYNYKG